MSLRPSSPTVALVAFLGELRRYRPRLVLGVFALMLARSVSEGLSFVLLIPMLGLDQLADGGLAATATATAPAAGVDAAGGLARLRALLARQPLELTLGLFLAAVLLRAALGYASAVASTTYLAGITDDVRQRVYRALSRAGWLHLAGGRQARDTHALTTQAECIEQATWYTLSLASVGLTLITGVGVALLLSPRHTLVVLASVIVLAWPMFMFQRWAYARGTAAARAYQHLFDVITARMGGLKLAKAFAIERRLEADFAESSQALRRAQIASQENSARAVLVQEGLSAVVLTALVYAALSIARTPGFELVLLIMIFARLAPLAHALQGQLRALVGLLPEYELLREREAEAVAAAEPLPERHDPIALRRSLGVDNVSFAYPADPGVPVLRAVSVEVAAGSAVGMLGLSGAGKSTLADIMAGLIVPDSGSVLVDDVPLDAERRPHWRASVAYVPQDAPLFHDTLRANLMLGSGASSEAEIWAALETVHAADLVRRLPAGLETMAGDRGIRLSGGERQRLRLASALLRRPQLLILDESTNALSPQDEAEIVTALRAAHSGMTILLVAHRPSSVTWTDRVLVLRDGRIVEDGPPAEVLRRIGGDAPIAG